MANLPTSIARYLTIENIQLFNRFYDLVILKGEKVVKVVDYFPDRDQSSITKAIVNFSDKVARETGGIPLFLRADKEWTSSELCDYLHSLTKEIEIDFHEIASLIDLDARRTLRVMLNGFSYQTFAQIERQMIEIDPELTFSKEFVVERSSRILDKIKSAKRIDFAIAESINEIDESPGLQVTKIYQGELCLLTNFTIQKSLLDANDHVTRNAIKSFKLISGDTSSINDFLIHLHFDFRDNDRAKEEALRYHPAEKSEFVRKEFNVLDTSTAVNLLVDMLLFDRNRLAMIATPEVVRHAMALQESDAYANGLISQRNKLQKYKISNSNINIMKFAIRKNRSYTYKSTDEKFISLKHLDNIFWSACLLLAKNQFG